MFLKIEDATFKKDKAFLEELRQKVERGKSVDKEFRAHFLQNMEADALHEGKMLISSIQMEICTGFYWHLVVTESNTSQIIWY